MTARILDGRALAAELRADLARDVAALSERGVVPRLRVVMVGEDESSLAYVRGMRALGAKIGVAIDVDVLSTSIDDSGVRAVLERYEHDERTHGVILQQPLPATLSIRRIAGAIPIRKDVDGSHPFNQGRLAFGTGARFVPATPAAVMLLLERSRAWPLRGRDVTVIGRSNVVGLPVSLLIMSHDATVTVTHKETAAIKDHVRRAEIVIAARDTRYRRPYFLPTR